MIFVTRSDRLAALQWFGGGAYGAFVLLVFCVAGGGGVGVEPGALGLCLVVAVDVIGLHVSSSSGNGTRKG